MAVFKHTYQGYSGPLTPAWYRLAVLVRYGYIEIWSSRVTVILFVLSFIPTLFGTLGIYFANSPTARALAGMAANVNITIDQRYFIAFFQIQCWISLALAAWISPRLVSPDLVDNALPVILSRPITRTGYVLGKFLVLASILSATTWIPSLFMFVFQAYSSPEAWAAKHAFIAFGMFAGAVLWIVFLSIFVLALSIWVKWKIASSGLIFGAILAPSAIGGIANQLLRTKWGYLLSIPDMMPTLWLRLLRVDSTWLLSHDISTGLILTTLLLICLGCVAALNAKIRAREVVRG